MDLEVVGRQALFFDDDAMVAFVNSPDALVGWNSLFIDRYDVRHLLSAPPPPRSRRRHQSSPLRSSDTSLESELDNERYLDLPPPSDDEGKAELIQISLSLSLSTFKILYFAGTAKIAYSSFRVSLKSPMQFRGSFIDLLALFFS